MISIVTFLWQEPHGKHNHLYLYTAAHVNTLRRMVDRHLAAPHRFVCVTDMPEGLDPDITVVPLDRTLIDARPGKRFAKLAIFRPDAADLFGDIIWHMDLDTVVTGPLDPLLAKFEGRQMVCWLNPSYDKPDKPRPRYNGSFFLLRAGTRPQVWTDLKPDEPYEDQDWVSTCLPDEVVWTDADGVYWLNYIRDGLPKNARLVTFAGRNAPWLPKSWDRYPWIRKHYT